MTVSFLHDHMAFLALSDSMHTFNAVSFVNKASLEHTCQFHVSVSNLNALSDCSNQCDLIFVEFV